MHSQIVLRLCRRLPRVVKLPDIKVLDNGSRSFSIRTNALLAAANDPKSVEGSKPKESGTERSDASTQVKTSGKAVTNVPFAKNLFLGKFDTQWLIFPESLEKAEVEELNQMYDPVEKYFSQLDGASFDQTSKIPEEVMTQLKELGLFGLQIPVEYGGLGFNSTKFARMTEALSLDPSISVMLGAHQSIGLKGIILFGNEEQKRKYLPKLATGESIACFCLTEPSSGSDAASIQTTATLSEDGKHYLLNGSKIWITNSGIADVMTVFAKTKVKNSTGETVDKVTAFIVERSFGGITNGKPEDKLGIRASNTCSIHFDNTPVPVENVIGQVGGGFKVAVQILNSGRFSMGASGAAGIRHMLRHLVEFAVSRKQFGRPISEFGLIQEKFARVALNAYAMESMSYLTASVNDSHTQPDTSVEAAMVKVFSSESVFEASHEAVQILGGNAYMKGNSFERFFRDTRILMIFEGTNEILRLYIALMCLQHAGGELRELVKKMKNPLNNVGFVFKKGFERLQTNRKNPSLNMKLYDHVHPTLSSTAEMLETRVVRLQFMVEKYLSTYADKMVEQQFALKRFADIGIDMFAITACLARASRSKSIGLRNCDQDLLMAKTFSGQALRRIDDSLAHLDLGDLANGDYNMQEIAKNIFTEGGYPIEHPLTRNW